MIIMVVIATAIIITIINADSYLAFNSSFAILDAAAKLPIFVGFHFQFEVKDRLFILVFIFEEKIRAWNFP